MANVKNILRKAAKAAPVRKFIDLPIDKIREEFEATFVANDVIIINTPTGSGKTMRIPMWANKLSGKTSFCLVPRRKMAQGAAQGAYMTTWIKEDMKKGPVTWTVGNDGKRAKDFKDKAIVYCTEGAFLSRSLDKHFGGSTILIDEVHEQNVDTEISLLLAAREWGQRGHKIVLMSATMDIERYKQYFETKGLSVGFLELKDDGLNRPFPLHKEVVLDPVKEIATSVVDGKRALIGVYGAYEFNHIRKELEMHGHRMKSPFPIFYFHSKMEEEEWKKAMDYDGPCVYIATNILQSGHTVPNIQVGCFTQRGRRIESVNGVNRLVTYKLSKSETLQWHGRLGRTEEGTIFMTKEQVEEFNKQTFLPTAKIKLENLEDTLAKFLVRGFDIRLSENRLLNQPSSASLLAAETTLKALRLFENKSLLKHIMQKGSGLRGGFMLSMADMPSVNLSKTMRFILMILDTNPLDRINGDMVRWITDHVTNDGDPEPFGLLNHIKSLMAKYGGYDFKTERFTKMNRLSPEEKEKLSRDGVFVKGLFMLNRNFLRVQEEFNEVLPSRRASEGYEPIKKLVREIFKAAWADRVYKKVGSTFYKVMPDGSLEETDRFMSNRTVVPVPFKCTLVALPEDIEIPRRVLLTLKNPTILVD